MMYTEAERALNREAGENRGRLLSATWIHGFGPRGGKVNIGQVRYDALSLLVIENKAQVVARFRGLTHYATLEVTGIIVRFPKIKTPKPKLAKP